MKSHTSADGGVIGMPGDAAVVKGEQLCGTEQKRKEKACAVTKCGGACAWLCKDGFGAAFVSLKRMFHRMLIEGRLYFEICLISQAPDTVPNFPVGSRTVEANELKRTTRAANKMRAVATINSIGQYDGYDRTMLYKVTKATRETQVLQSNNQGPVSRL